MNRILPILAVAALIVGTSSPAMSDDMGQAMSMNASSQQFPVKVTVKSKSGSAYRVTVAVNVPDTCYTPGPVVDGLPPGVSVKEKGVHYVWLAFTHDVSSDQACGQVSKSISTSRDIKLSSSQTQVTGYAVLTETKGQATDQRPQ